MRGKGPVVRWAVSASARKVGWRAPPPAPRGCRQARRLNRGHGRWRSGRPRAGTGRGVAPRIRTRQAPGPTPRRVLPRRGRLRGGRRSPPPRRAGPAGVAPGPSPAVAAGARAVARIVRDGKPVYGINTGFGKLAQTHIPADQLELLQRNLVLSHSVGVGAPLARRRRAPRAALKVASLARGYSGVRPEVVDAMRGAAQRRALPVHPLEGLGRRLGRPGAARAPVGRAARRWARCASAAARCAAGGAAQARARAARARPQGRPRAAQRHAGLDRARARRALRRREPVRRGAGRRRDVGRRRDGQRHAVRRAHPRAARAAAASASRRRYRALLAGSADPRLAPRPATTRCRTRTACAASRR